MSTVTCICVGAYSGALTYGRKYQATAAKERNVKVKGDNGRIRWHPIYCFDMTGKDAPQVSGIWIEAEEWAPGEWDIRDGNTDVLVTLDDSTQWVATFFTYQGILSLADKNKTTGECMSGGYFWATDMVLIDEMSRERIEQVVDHLLSTDLHEFRRIFSQGEEGNDEVEE